MIITPKDLKEKISNKDDFQLIDVREDYEFEDFNIGGINIPLDEVFSSLEKISKNKPVIFCCNTGKKSAAILHTVKRKLGLNNVYSLQGGVTSYLEEM
ncbi:MAG: rhodanese-like domain-containing protein [Vicingus serpentipes]|nr:rhodanese-like domain-containing protein [Vicingus serpentipes]